MNVQFKEMINEITRFMENEANTKTVIGQAFKLGEFECVPVIRLGMGFGSGGGERDLKPKETDELLGAGAGMGIDPIGFLVTHKDEISFVSTKTNNALSKALDKAPELLEKWFETRKQEPVHN
jgi:uncharacterized spore protein YtfJ